MNRRALPSTDLPGLLFGLFAVLAACTAIRLHWAASLTLPVPWGDEAYFLWQACAFSRWGSFAAPEMDPTRPILLLPFVYQGIVGAAFKVLGCSLEVARYLSLAFSLIGFAFLVLFVRRHAMPFTALVLVSAVFLNSKFIAMANNARMEALNFAVIMGALLLVQRRQAWLALAVLSVSLMIHPNGIFFLVPVAIYAVLTLRIHRERPSNAAITVLVLSAVVHAANGLYALKYWEGFVHDLALRVGETAHANQGLAQFGGWHGVVLAAIFATAALGSWLRVPVGHMLVFAIGAWLYGRVRAEMWYGPFADLSFLLLSLAVLEIVWRKWRSVRFIGSSGIGLPKAAWMRPALATALAAGVLIIHIAAGHVERPRRYINNIWFAGMRIGDGVPYFTSDDRNAILGFLKGVAPQRDIYVDMYPWGDGLLLSQADDRIKIQVPYFDAVFYAPQRWAWGYRPTEYPPADVYLVRKSSHHPERWKRRGDHVLARASKATNVTTPVIVHARDGTEVWYAFSTTLGTK